MYFSGSDVIILNSLLGDRLVISKTDDLIQSYESLSTSTSQGQSVCLTVSNSLFEFTDLTVCAGPLCVCASDGDDDDDEVLF